MKIKILFPNEKGKIELTKIELEALLEECYQDGLTEGKKLQTINYPHYNGYITTSDSTGTNNKITYYNTITSEGIKDKINE
jgi:hypothetical protein